MNTLTASEKAARSAKRAETKARIAAMTARIEFLKTEASKVVATGKCPDCGANIHQNLSLAGWFKCDRGGSASFRRDHSGAHCSWQVFTE